jgi:hypothetical protein
MIAKNVGIRRARGESILATNIDILFSSELVHFIADRRLQPNKMYRMDRWDVLPDVPVDAPPEEQLNYCRSHLIRVNTRDGTLSVTPDGGFTFGCDDIAEPDGGLSLGSGWSAREMAFDEPFRWVENDAEVLIDGMRGRDQVLSVDVEPSPSSSRCAVSLELQDELGKRLSSIWVDRRTVVAFLLPPSNGPVLVRLHAGEGIRTADNAQVRKFRVFRCELVPGSNAASSSARMPSPAKQIAVGRNFWWRPWRGIRSARASRYDILSPGLVAIWEDGWYPVEHFKGKTFRWMTHHGSMILLSPYPVKELSLDVEAGPAVGFKPIQVEVRDHARNMLACADVKGRTELRVPLPPVKGVRPLSIDVRGGGEPKIVPGDPRVMALQMFDCQANIEEMPVRTITDLFEVGEIASGVWHTRGRTKLPKSGGSVMAMFNEAEMVVRAPDAEVI